MPRTLGRARPYCLALNPLRSVLAGQSAIRQGTRMVHTHGRVGVNVPEATAHSSSGNVKARDDVVMLIDHARLLVATYASIEGLIS